MEMEMGKMEDVSCSSSSDLKKKKESSNTNTKGGLITMPFIIANEAFEKVASYGLLPNMIMYLIKDYHLKCGYWNQCSVTVVSCNQFHASTWSFLLGFLLGSVQDHRFRFHCYPPLTVASIKNRHFPLPPSNTDVCYYHHRDSKLIVPTNKLRFLNKACIIRNAEKDLNRDGTASNPWRLCTVDQVEELKALLKVMPMWSTGIMLAVNMMSQHSFPLLQANSMDRHLTAHFKIPAGSFSMFTIISLTVWIVIYDRLVLPLLVKLRGKPYGLSHKERMGIGLVLSVMATSTSAIVEHIRRKTTIQEGFSEDPHAVLRMSALWLVPQHCLGGLAEAFNAIGQTEFFYSEFPKSMSSIAASLFGLGLAVGNLIVGLLVSVVDDVTKKGGKESWVSNNLNKGHYD